MTGLLTAAGIADNYGLVLFVHLSALLGVISAGALAHYSEAWRAGIGLVLFTLGLGFAIWARMHLGRNWGTPMTQKDEPELVMSGPYHLGSSLERALFLDPLSPPSRRVG